MPVFDIYCVVCGIPANPIFWYEEDLERLEDILDNASYSIPLKNNRLSKKKKEIDKTLLKNYNKFIKEVNNKESSFKWSDNTFLITDDNKLSVDNSFIHDSNDIFNKNKTNYSISKANWSNNKFKRALICHKSCYNLLYKKLNYKLSIDDIENKLNTRSLLKSYGKVVDKYTGLQDFPWTMMILNKNQYSFFELLLNEKTKVKISKNIDLLMDPLKNKRNQDRILKIWKPIANKKIKKKKNRPSPSESATLYKVDKKKKGNDGNMYIIVINKNGVKRWKKV